jgi:KipI family sensor histidine kinase inhibitor
MRFITVGLSGLLVELPDLNSALASYAAIRDAMLPGVIQILPAARTVLITFDPAQSSASKLSDSICALATDTPQNSIGKTIDIPVVYDGEDLQEVADMLMVSPEMIVDRHTAHSWTVAFSGFAPGFSYLSNGDPLFDVPRRPSPRISVPAGSVALAGTFSGIYPRASSGGWQLIGMTPERLWDDERVPPALLQPGDTIHFLSTRAKSLVLQGEHGLEASSMTKSLDLGQDATSTEGQATATSDSDSSNTVLQVIQSGTLSTIQDDGRKAVTMGVSGSGAMDRFSFHLANELVGNPTQTPAIEITGGNASFTTSGDMVIAITGAPVCVSIYSDADASTSVANIARQEAFVLRKGETLKLGSPDSGFRNYLAIQGGIEVDDILDSASTDTMAHIGPHALSAGDCLQAGHQGFHSTSAAFAWSAMPKPGEVTELSVTLGPRDDWFMQQSLDTLFQQQWTVSSQSNRVGLRLQGDTILQRSNSAELLSEGTLPGAIQVPSSGQPVVFMRDHPVTGGYPVIAILDSASLDIAAQLPPGALIRFLPHTTGKQKGLRP